MASIRGLARSSLLTVTAYVFVASSANAAQPPDVVVSDINENTAMGTGSLFSLLPVAPAGFAVTGNTGAGYATLYNNTFGYNNTAVGWRALEGNTEGRDNTSTGAFALNANTTGNYNTAVGMAALELNSTGSSNTAVGSSALGVNFGSNNTAVGVSAIQSGSGSNNTAVGVWSLGSISTGHDNTAIGFNAMIYNMTGLDNTAVGHNALATNQGGSNNIAVGSNAGYYVRGGKYNIEIGNVGGANDAGAIRIGTSSQQGSAYIAGIANSHVAGSAVYITATGQLGVLASSERYKTDVTSMGSTSEKVRQLRPVTFRLKSDRKAGVQYGLIAEEVAKVYPELVIRGPKGEIEGVRYEELTPMLLNEVQQQQRQLAEQQTKLQEVLSQLTDLRHAVQERMH